MKREAGVSPAQARCCESPRGRRGCHEPLGEAKRKTSGRRQRQEASQKTCHGVKACCTLPADREEAREGGVYAAHGGAASSQASIRYVGASRWKVNRTAESVHKFLES